MKYEDILNIYYINIMRIIESPGGEDLVPFNLKAGVVKKQCDSIFVCKV